MSFRYKGKELLHFSDKSAIYIYVAVDFHTFILAVVALLYLSTKAINVHVIDVLCVVDFFVVLRITLLLSALHLFNIHIAL